jgi:hypothetical protein
MNLRIAHTTEDGGVAYIIPAPGFSVEQLLHLVPEGAQWKVLDASEIPVNRTYRGAWTGLEEISIDLEKAKQIQKSTMIAKAIERTPRDMFGQQDLTAVKAEIDAIDWTAITTLNEVYNTWPASINVRQGAREYILQ